MNLIMPIIILKNIHINNFNVKYDIECDSLIL